MAILRVIAAGQWQGMRLAEIVEACGLSVGTVHRILKALVDEGLVERRAAERRYRVGGEVSLLALARGHRSPMVAAAEPFLRTLSEETGESVFLTVRHRLDSVCIDRKMGDQAVKLLSLDVGARRPLGYGVGGLVLLAHMPVEEAAAILEFNRQRLAQHGLAPDRLAAGLPDIRNAGYAFTESGVVPGARAVSVPIVDRTGRALAALTVGTIQARLPRSRVASLVVLMSGEAAKLSGRLEATRGEGGW